MVVEFAIVIVIRFYSDYSVCSICFWFFLATRSYKLKVSDIKIDFWFSFSKAPEGLFIDRRMAQWAILLHRVPVEKNHDKYLLKKFVDSELEIGESI